VSQRRASARCASAIHSSASRRLVGVARIVCEIAAHLGFAAVALCERFKPRCLSFSRRCLPWQASDADRSRSCADRTASSSTRSRSVRSALIYSAAAWGWKAQPPTKVFLRGDYRTAAWSQKAASGVTPSIIRCSHRARSRAPRSI